MYFLKPLAMCNKLLPAISIALITTFAVSCKKEGTPPSPPPPSTQVDIATVDNKITQFMTTHNIPGASLAISKNGKLVYMKGYGYADQAANEKVTTNHRFRLASVSKTFTGVAILKMVQDGRFPLDAKVFGSEGLLGNDFGTPPYNSNVSNMTIRHLLQNVSGSWGSSTGGDVIDHNPSYNNTQMLNWILNTRPNPKTPGSFYDYSNINFWIAGRVIEKVSGKSYINFLKDHVLAPLGITSVDIAGKTLAEKKQNEVSYYGQGSDASYVYNIAFPRRDADGGLISTAKDLLKFVAAIDGFTTRPDMLNNSLITALTTGSSVFPSYGLGIGIWSAENLWYNYGSLPGTRSAFMRHDNGMSAALIFNSRVNPSAETAFVQGMQSLVLDLVKNTYPWQDIDQF